MTRAEDLDCPVAPPSELALARSLLADAGVSPDYAASILEQLEMPREAWPTCCGSACDPCVGVLNRVALGVLARRRANTP